MLQNVHSIHHCLTGRRRKIPRQDIHRRRFACAVRTKETNDFALFDFKADVVDIRNLIRELGKERTIILSTHILSEVKAVCDRILIINEGKIVADELTENIEGALRGNRRIAIRIEGPSAKVHNVLKKISGVIYAEISVEHEDGSATFIVESKNEIDVRKPIFYKLAENSWPILSLEFTGANLEDIFISVVDEAEATTGKKA